MTFINSHTPQTASPSSRHSAWLRRSRSSPANLQQQLPGASQGAETPPRVAHRPPLVVSPWSKAEKAFSKPLGALAHPLWEPHCPQTAAGTPQMGVSHRHSTPADALSSSCLWLQAPCLHADCHVGPRSSYLLGACKNPT